MFSFTVRLPFPTGPWQLTAHALLNITVHDRERSHLLLLTQLVSSWDPVTCGFSGDFVISSDTVLRHYLFVLSV